MYICSLCLIMSLWKLSESGFSFHCPVQSHWKHRAENNCGSVDGYFCLFNRNEHYFTEFCRKTSDFEAPGQKLIVAGSSNGTLQGADCNSEFYQPFKFLSSGSSRCVYEKSHCTAEGQVTSSNGTLEKDRSCRCDYTRGYDFIVQPKHRCYCVPSEEDCSCHLKICSSNYILSPDYECLNENEWKTSFYCDSISTVVMPKDPEIPLSTDNSSLESYVLANRKAACVAVLVIFILVLFLAIIFAVLPILKECFCRMKRKHTEVDEKIASLIAIEKSSLVKQIDAIDSEKQELKGKISKLEDDIGKVPYHVLELQKETLMNWSNELANFFVTKAAQSVYQRIQTEKLVAIIGPTGTGKSACAYHIALRLKNEYGYTIVSARQPSDITQYYLPGTNQVFIIDDFIGKYVFDVAEAVSWEKEGPFLHKVLSNNDQTKVILTCRKSIWHPEICERFKLSAFVCDLHTNELRLTLSEKRTICDAYLEKSDIKAITDEILMMYPFLPSLCSIFSSKDVGSVENFFTLPIQFIEQEIDNYKMKSPERHISLAVLAIEQKFTKQSFFDNIENEELIKNLFGESGSQMHPPKKLIISHLEALTDTFVKVNNDCFEFIHQTMQNIVLYCIAKTFIISVLKYCKRDVFKNQIRLACIREEQTVPAIKVISEHEEAYFTRLARELSEGQYRDVFKNNQNAFPIFRQKFIAFLNNDRKGNNWKTNSDGFTVLHVLSSLGYGDYVALFMKFDKGMIHKTDAKGNTPLHLASMNGHLNIVKLLVENGRNVHLLNNDRLSPFFYACENDLIPVVNYLINLEDDFVKINETYMMREHKSVLHIACQKGSTELIKILLDHGATVDIQDKGGLTPLHLTCLNGQHDTASLLLKAGANVNRLDNLGMTPVYYACTGNYKNIVELLIQNKANINKSSSNGSTPLHAACEKESIDIVDILLKKGSKVDAQEKSGETPLHIACRNGNEQIVKLLIDSSASVDSKTKDKMRPFHEACKNGHLNVVDILLKKNVKYDKKNKDGRTGLFFSCENGYNDIVKIILNRKADLNLTDKDGVTALHAACINNHQDVVNTLLEKKANVNLADVCGETPLYKSCDYGNIEIVKILLLNGANVKICGTSGLSPVAIAKKKGFNNIVVLLNN
ncbi:uncharacterized protein LOC127714493 isoform X3 [Mytilus californianus]|uniref:uncharacterized protein LOC127714493 isoform X3 n=1 Tax=Mytilus californianus TaxID=6549 RepID=UPI002246C235|nr:uncharacterized protein LOC127714493 isoform X3 [Mytilus californianus]